MRTIRKAISSTFGATSLQEFTKAAMGRDLTAELLEVGQIALESSKEYCGGLLEVTGGLCKFKIISAIVTWRVFRPLTRR